MSHDIDAKSRERLLSGRAWEDLCETLKNAGRVIDGFGDSIDDLDRTEWYRFLSRLTRHGFHRYVENSEAGRPRLLDTPWRQAINFQSPDQDHLIAEFFEGSSDYRITGNRGTIPYFVMASWEGGFPADHGARDWSRAGAAGLAEFDPAVMRTTAFLSSDQIRFDTQGNFTVIVSQERPADDCDWLAITPQTVGVLVRTLYHLREETMAPTMRIERLDGIEPQPLQAGGLSAGLARAGQIVLGYAELVRRWWQESLDARPNRITFDLAMYLANGGVADRHHGFGTWECRPEEALVVRFRPPPAEYWILQLCNIWQENLDNYEEGNGYLQKYRARYESDGTVCIVVSHDDPGVDANWIAPYGHCHGGWSLRFIKSEGAPPDVTVHRLPLEELREGGLGSIDAVNPIRTGGLTC